MKTKNSMTKIMAFLALFGIIIGIIGTALIMIFGNNSNTPEQLQNLIKSSTGTTIEVQNKTLTGETK